MTDYRDKQGNAIPAAAFENDAAELGSSSLSAENKAALSKRIAAIKAAVIKRREGR